MDRKNIISLAMVIVIVAVYMSTDLAKASPPPEDPCVHIIALGCDASFIVSRTCPPEEYLEIATTISKTGALTNTKVRRYTSDDQYNAECLEAVCNVFKVRASVIDKPFDMKIGDGSILRPIGLLPAPVKQFETAHPEMFKGKEKFVVIHRIPLNVWQGSDPNLFSAEELKSEKNLIGIPIGENSDYGTPGERANTPKYVEFIEKRGQRWADLLASKHRKASKAEILECAKELDNQIR